MKLCEIKIGNDVKLPFCVVVLMHQFESFSLPYVSYLVKLANMSLKYLSKAKKDDSHFKQS